MCLHLFTCYSLQLLGRSRPIFRDFSLLLDGGPGRVLVSNIRSYRSRSLPGRAAVVPRPPPLPRTNEERGRWIHLLWGGSVGPLYLGREAATATSNEATRLAKRYDERIEVAWDASADRSTLVSFWWRRRRYAIDQQLADWRAGGHWWDRELMREHEYFRVLARPADALASGDLDPDGFLLSSGAVFDIYRDRMTGQWRLARVWD